MWVPWGLPGISAAHLTEAAAVLPVGHLGHPYEAPWAQPLGPIPNYSAMDVFKPSTVTKTRADKSQYSRGRVA